jgi:Tfp pilus assembly protein PilF
MTNWKIIGVVATLVIICIIPFYAFREKSAWVTALDRIAAPQALFVGSQKCADCHKQAFDRWKGSHHDKAMDVATEESVLGDFGDALFEHFDTVSRFYRKDGRFFVHTPGPDGKPGEYEVTHTFGYYPLQQYLVPFPGGRLQCLPIAWDARLERWYHLYPDEPLEPDDWIYWTNAGQNWNGMCAECHSTNLKKNYDVESDTYRTTWSEINVGCEACHGPGSLHVKWAELPEMGRPETENYDLVVKTSQMTSRQQVELCAPCHARRTSLGDNIHTNVDFMDYAVPRLLDPAIYYPDGQILDEVYVYGSFIQSKMYDREIRCSDCHDVHSIKRIEEGNAICLQCHRADDYDTKAHHFHKKGTEKGEPIRSKTGEVLFEVGSGAKCEACHMPGRDYMGIDYRPDHSFRVPRPDLTLETGAPNACKRCHHDKTEQWSLEHMAKWYGSKTKPHYGSILNAGRGGLPEAKGKLMQLADDRLFPAIVRATALAQLGGYPGTDVVDALGSALSDEEPLMRHTAVQRLEMLPPDQRIKFLVPMLYDPVKAVRIEAAAGLTAIPPGQLNTGEQTRFEAVLQEYKQAMGYTADFAASRHNLGNLYANLGQPDLAENHYLAAIGIDSQFYPAKVNLAMLYNGQGKKTEAEDLLRQVVGDHPDMHEIQYSLALLLSERGKYAEASLYLATAARGLPDRARVHYNLGMLMDYLRKDLEAEAALSRALEIEPDNMQFLEAHAQYYLKRGKFKAAKPYAQRLADNYPSNPNGDAMLQFIDKNLKSEK